MNTTIWTHTVSNTTLHHAFDPTTHRALCNKRIKARECPGGSTECDHDSYTPHYRTADDVRGRNHRTLCEGCVTATTKQPTDETPTATAVTMEEVIKEHKLSDVMVKSIQDTSHDPLFIRATTGTVVALINRGIVTAATKENGHSNQLTELGHQVYAALNSTSLQPGDLVMRSTEATIIKREKLSPVMVESIMYRATTLKDADGLPSLDGIVYCSAKTEGALVARGIMHKTESTLTAKGKRIVTEILADRADRKRTAERVAEIRAAYAEKPEITVTPDEVAYTEQTETDEDAMRREAVDRISSVGLELPREIAESIAGVDEWDGHAGTLGPDATNAVLDAMLIRQQERLRYAKSVAWHITHPFGDDRPAPWDLGSLRQFADEGVISADRMMREIRDHMVRVARLAPTTAWELQQAGNALAELGWLHGWIMELGYVADDGWQERDSIATDWDKVELYPLDDLREMPAWTDWTDGSRAGCEAVIQPRSRWEEAENCGDGVSRQEFHSASDEGSMCPTHREQWDASQDHPW